MAEPKKPRKGKPSGTEGAGSGSIKDTIQESIIMKMKEEAKAEVSSHEAKAEEAPSWRGRLSGSRRKASSKEINFFMRQMAVILSAGVPLMRALKILAERVRNASFRLTLIEVMEDVERGTQFWSALARHPEYFNNMAVNVIRTGEESGALVDSMTYLANYRDREEDMIRSVQKAVTYPLFLLVLAFGVVIILITTIIPVFATQYAQMNIELPWPTRVVFGLSSTLTNFWLIFFLVLILAIWGYRRIDSSEGLRAAVDRLKLRLPIFGRILTNIYTVQFATMTSLLLKSGLPLPRTLELVRATIDNTLFRKAFDEIKKSVERGRTLAESVSEHHVFPAIVQDMVAVGEEAGSLPLVLDQVADSYQKEVDYDTAVIGTLLEPIMIVCLGLVVGFIAFSVFMPYFNMAAHIGAL